MLAEHGLMLSAIFFGGALLGLLTAQGSDDRASHQRLQAGIIAADPTAPVQASETPRTDAATVDQLREERDRLIDDVLAARARLDAPQPPPTPAAVPLASPPQ